RCTVTGEERLAVVGALLQAWCLADGAQHAIRQAAAVLPAEEAETLWYLAAELGTVSATLAAYLENRGFAAPPPAFASSRPTPGGVN
ncbi:MAG: hypothetical protein IRZ00_03195, partial [Gemmatimonadetes bacterium]|nr:hypothetical protein [Gemmatimonadota bacterium]